MKKTLASIALGIMLLTGCTYEPFTGTVDDKDVHRYSTITYPCGNAARCAPFIQWHKSHRLHVSNGVKDDKWNVKQEVYESCNVGDTVTRDEKGTVACS